MVVRVGQNTGRPGRVYFTEWREHFGLTQEQLAERIGCGKAAVSKLENGHTMYNQSSLEAWAAALHVPPHQLLKPPASSNNGATASPSNSAGILRIPILDAVAAGRLAVPTSQIPVEDVPLLAFADLGPGEFFALKVDGTSMDRISPDGSIIVVNRRDRTLVTGRFYVFSHRGAATYKRWQGNDPPYLEPFSTDASHKPIFVKKMKDVEVIGRVKRTVLDL